MFSLEKVKKDIAKNINEALGEKIIQASDLVYPPKPDMGDLSLTCFKMKSHGLTPEDLFTKINPIKEAKWNWGKINTLKKEGPYINFFLDKQLLFKCLEKEISKGSYGYNNDGKKEKVLLEFSNANTHKEYHVGHLRNICYGDAVTKILSANGYDSIPISYINDFGIHVAKTIWWTYHPENKTAKTFLEKNDGENRGYFLGQMYSQASQKEKEDKTAKQTINLVMKKVESRQGQEYELWQETREWSIEYFKKIYDELNVEFCHTFYESEYIDKGRKIVETLLKKKILEVSDGAVIANLEKYNLGVLVILRSDGTATYPVADLALAQEKFKKFKPEKSVYIVDIRQGLYFKQLFKMIELMGVKNKMIHLGYDFVKLPSGMMSSRSGNVITYKDLYDQIFKKALEETKSRHADWPSEKINEVANKLTIGAIKFEMIKINANQIIVFDINKALSFSGFTAAYLQYTCARINSIVKKAKDEKASKANFEKLTEDKEFEIIMKLAKYPEIISRAGKNYDPSEIAKYLFELAQIFNDYYHAVPILKAEEEIKTARLSLISAVNQTIVNGLNLLGIKIIPKM